MELNLKLEELKEIARENKIPLGKNLTREQVIISLVSKGVLFKEPHTPTVINKLLNNRLVNDTTIDEFNTCDLKSLDFIRGQASNSASDSEIYLVKLSKMTMAFSLFLKIYEVKKTTTMMMMEGQYYNIVTQLYLQKRLRNVIPAISTSTNCNFNSLKELVLRKGFADQNDMEVRIAANLLQMGKNRLPVEIAFLPQPNKFQSLLNKVNLKRYGFIMTPQVYNNSPGDRFTPSLPNKYTLSTFKSYLATLPKIIKKALDVNDQNALEEINSTFKQYVFQLIYTLVALLEIGFNHNDLHMGNILIDHYYPGESKLAGYIWNYGGEENSAFTFTKYMPRIYDFDRSTMNNLVNKGTENYMNRYGQSSQFVEKCDILKFVCGVIKNLFVPGGPVWIEIYSKYISWILEMTLPDNSAGHIVETFNNTFYDENCFFTTNNNSYLKDSNYLDTLITNPREILTRMKPYMLTKAFVKTDAMKEGLAEFKQLPQNGSRLDLKSNN